MHESTYCIHLDSCVGRPFHDSESCMAEGGCFPGIVAWVCKCIKLGASCWRGDESAHQLERQSMRQFLSRKLAPRLTTTSTCRTNTLSARLWMPYDPPEEDFTEKIRHIYHANIFPPLFHCSTASCAIYITEEDLIHTIQSTVVIGKSSPDANYRHGSISYSWSSYPSQTEENHLCPRWSVKGPIKHKMHTNTIQVPGR